jgi:hypothetical protein
MSQCTIEPCGGGGDWYFVTDGDWVEGGDMSESTAAAIAQRLNEQAAEIERLLESAAEKHQLYSIVCDELKRLNEQAAEIKRLRIAAAFLKSRMAIYQGQRICSQATWNEFERRMNDEQGASGSANIDQAPIDELDLDYY